MASTGSPGSRWPSSTGRRSCCGARRAGGEERNSFEGARPLYGAGVGASFIRNVRLVAARDRKSHVTDWNYKNPHTWLIIEGFDADGEITTWSFEGAVPVRASRQGVTGLTFRKGKLVRVIVSPLRDGRNSGTMCFVVKEDSSLARPNDGASDSLAVIDVWQQNG